MKKVIRAGVFETNSSSTHSLSIVTKKVYADWADGETIMVQSWRDDDKFVSREEAINDIITQLKKDSEDFTTLEKYMEDNGLDIDDLFDEFDYTTYDNFGGDFETFEREFTTPSGDEMVAFGYYGEDR